MAVLRILAKLNNIERRLEKVILSLGIIVLAMFLIANAIGRKVGLLLYFVDELATFLVIFITFIAVSHAARRGSHIRMEAVYDFMPKKIQKVMMLTISFGSALVMFWLAYLATSYVLQAYNWGHISHTLRVPYWMVYVVIPLGLFLAGVHYVLTFVKNILEKEVWVSFEKLSGYK